jgi:hypothetical protein
MEYSNPFSPSLLVNHVFLHEAMERHFENIDCRARVPDRAVLDIEGMCGQS